MPSMSGMAGAGAASQPAPPVPRSNAAATSEAASPLAGMPPVDDPNNIYSHSGPDMLSPVVRNDPPLVYVPNSNSNTVDVIDPKTFKIVEHFAVPGQPQHVVPSYDLKTLWVNSDTGNALVPIDPTNGKPGQPVPVEDPYNLYFTPDGKYAVVMAERMKRIDWRDPHTMALVKSTPAPCAGVNHADFSANGRYFIVSCEFDGQLLKVDTATQQVVGRLSLGHNAMPQDVKTSPDGRVFYVADMNSNGVWVIEGDSFANVGFIATGKGAHGLYVSRDSKYLYVTNRDEGSVSLIDLATRKVATKWVIPGGGSPDMGNVSADGKSLWLSGRYDGVVYDISTVDGHLIKKIKVGSGPHGLCVFPIPGRYSLGHTGVTR
jgi:YVTN family beta-propeller protein